MPGTIQCIALRERLYKIVPSSSLQSALISADEASEFVKNTNMLGTVCFKFMAFDNQTMVTSAGAKGGQIQSTTLLTQSSISSINMYDASVTNGASVVNPIGIVDSLRSIGCIETIIPFLGRVTSSSELCLTLRLLSISLHGHETNLDTLSRINGYKILAFLLHRAFNLSSKFITTEVINEILSLVALDDGGDMVPHGLLSNPNFVRHILVSHEVWRCLDSKLRHYLLLCIFRLVNPLNPNAAFNAMTLNRLVRPSYYIYIYIMYAHNMYSLGWLIEC